jgi:hypothetical protein
MMMDGEFYFIPLSIYSSLVKKAELLEEGYYKKLSISLSKLVTKAIKVYEHSLSLSFLSLSSFYLLLSHSSQTR